MKNKKNNLFRKEQGNSVFVSEKKRKGIELGNDRLGKTKLHYEDTEREKNTYEKAARALAH